MDENLKEELQNEDMDTVGSIEEILLNTQEQSMFMKEQCDMMRTLIEKQIQVKDETIDRMHKELEFYKQDAQDRFANQLIKSIIKIRTDMKKNINSDKWNDMTVEDLKREYTYIFEDITDFLEQQNVDPFETQPGEDFDGSKHQVVKSIATDDASLDKKIAVSKSEGYIKGNKLLIAERVDVYQLNNN